MDVAPLRQEELAAWLRLLETPGIGRQRARRLLRAFGSPQEVFRGSPQAWQSVLDGASWQGLAHIPEGWEDLVERTWQWLQQPDCHIITLGDPRYPLGWLELADPPLMVHARGRLDLLERPALAVVGSRHPSRQGEDNARQFGAALSQAGLGVISGLALGVDAAAHEGALTGPGSTVAFVGTGIDRIYPRQNQALAVQIATEGLLVSEHVLGTPPMAPHFPQRNRLIAGLGLGTLVVEATLQSGSLITARLTMEANREVFAIPGSIHNPQSKGCHKLIKEGAKLVESTQDILDELKGALRGHQAALPPGSAVASVVMGVPDVLPAAADTSTETSTADAATQDPLLQALGWTPSTLDALQARTGWPTADLNIRLLELELSGQVVRLPGQLFQRQSSA